MGPSLARIVEQRHVSEPVTIIHMAATTQNLWAPDDHTGLPKHGGTRSPLPSPPQCPYLIANDVYLVLDLGHPLADDGKQFWDGGLRVKQDFLAGRVIGVEKGESWKKKSRVTPGKLPPPLQSEGGRPQAFQEC